jgi:hypothetical protein
MPCTVLGSTFAGPHRLFHGAPRTPWRKDSLQRVIKLTVRNGGRSRVYNNLATLLREEKRLSEAREFYEHTVGISEALTKEKLGNERIQGGIGDVL